eukprot:GDKI01044192.1.p1 GENE.GDKI01044192.1~~GDKI01044192.1.p1  ORF type:complete len:202 (-),score=66.99 GDKI01044192.1:605-1210(-)
MKMRRSVLAFSCCALLAAPAITAAERRNAHEVALGSYDAPLLHAFREDVSGTWHLVKLVTSSSGDLVDVPAGVDPTFTLPHPSENRQWKPSGHGGCNNWSGEIETLRKEGEEDVVRITNISSTKMLCEEATMDVEQQYLAHLQSVTAWTLSDNLHYLTMWDAHDDIVLMFQRTHTVTHTAGGRAGDSAVALKKTLRGNLVA